MPEAFRWRGIHLDLKGAPLPIDALIREIEQMAAWGINLLLMEYEDTFPYVFDPAIRTATAYSPADIARIVRTCKSLNIQIVPLVQTFGHLEFVLKCPRYRHLAQTAGSFGSLDPTLPESRALVLHMVDELLAAHPDSQWLHLGGDEVWDLGEGERSKARAAEIGKDGLYLEHMMPIIEHVAGRGVRPILWDDMMRKWSAESLVKLVAKVDLMVWSYGANPFAWISQDVLDKFQGAGLHLWAGAAFKGADGISADLPHDPVRMSNMEAWAGYAVQNRWEGMVATGWSRYSGTTTYCELWQGAPMALYLAALVMRKGRYEVGDWEKACRETIGVTGLAADWATQRAAAKVLEAAGASSASRRLAQLKAIAAIQQWRREAHGLLADRWQALGFHEDAGLRNEWDIERIRKLARDLQAGWSDIASAFERAMRGELHPRDIRDYLASRRRMGMQFLTPIPGEE